MLPNREGRFKATILEHGVAETGPNSLATFVCRFQLVQELISGQWEPVEEDFDITGYFYLEKRDGSLNTVIIDQLRKAFGWDGRDPFWLQDTDFSGLQVQIKLGWERWNDQDRLKVQWIDAEDATPLGVPQTDENVRRSIANRLGAKLRANAGGADGADRSGRSGASAGAPGSAWRLRPRMACRHASSGSRLLPLSLQPVRESRFDLVPRSTQGCRVALLWRHRCQRLERANQPRATPSVPSP